MRYRVSQLAKMLDVSTNTVRRYEKIQHIKSVRDEKNGYRYYTDEDFITIMSIKNKKRYGFTHTDLVDMKEYSVQQTIQCYKEKKQLLDQQITYLTGLKQRMDDDLILMEKITAFPEPGYTRECVELSYVLFPQEAQLLKDNQRVKKIHEYLSKATKVQLIYLIKREDIMKDTLVLHKGCAVKLEDLEEFHLQEDEYTKRYEKKEVYISLVKIPQEETTMSMDSETIRSLFLEKVLEQLEEHGFMLAGDILGVRITTAMEEGEYVEYVLLNTPYVRK